MTSTQKNENDNKKVALVTGSARRIGAYIAQFLHQHNYDVVLHYRHSGEEAKSLRDQLNAQRPHSCIALHADLANPSAWEQLAQQTLSWKHQLDLLVNNASSYFPTQFGDVTLNQWSDLMSSNAQAPFFITQHLLPTLKQSQGSIINLTDAMLGQPGTNVIPYTMAKSALETFTKGLAKALAPEVRVNAIAPGVIMWPEQFGEITEQHKTSELEDVPMGRTGTAEDIAKAILFLAESAPYVTGQTLAVDGGRSL